MKMGKEILTFGDIKIEKHEFQRYKNSILKMVQTLITYQHLRTFLLPKKTMNILFIGYINDVSYKTKSLRINLPKMRAYVKGYHDQTKWMYFLIEDDDLLEKYSTTWDKVRTVIKKRICQQTYV